LDIPWNYLLYVCATVLHGTGERSGEHALVLQASTLLHQLNTIRSFHVNPTLHSSFRLMVLTPYWHSYWQPAVVMTHFDTDCATAELKSGHL